jgi:hypothetical protein
MINIKLIFFKNWPKEEACNSGIEFIKYKIYTRFTVQIQSSCINLPFQTIASQSFEASETQLYSVKF